MAKKHTQYVRRGKLAITKKQYDILCLLRMGKEAEQPLVKLEISSRRDERTLSIMQWEKDWIVESLKALGERRFAITSRGLTLLQALEAPPMDMSLCRACQTAPRYVSPGGHRSMHCFACHKAYNRARYAVSGKGYNRAKPCSLCKQKERFVNGSGNVEPYCRQCRLVISDRHRARKLAWAHEQEALGALPACSQCGQNSIYMTRACVYTVCKSCLSKAHRQAGRRRHLRRLHQIQQRLKGFKAS